MIQLRRWHLFKKFSTSTQEEDTYACGEAYGHPKFPNGVFINTTHIVSMKYDQDNNDVIFTTKSGSEYIASMNDLVSNNDDLVFDTLKELNAEGEV